MANYELKNSSYKTFHQERVSVENAVDKTPDRTTNVESSSISQAPSETPIDTFRKNSGDGRTSATFNEGGSLDTGALLNDSSDNITNLPDLLAVLTTIEKDTENNYEDQGSDSDSDKVTENSSEFREFNSGIDEESTQPSTNPDIPESVTWVTVPNAELFATNGPQPTDVDQGGIGDCYLLATLAAIAAQNPDAIKDMIKDNGDGTFTVRFYSQLPNGKAFPVYITVTGELPEGHCYNPNGGSLCMYGANTPIDPDTGMAILWPAIIEKAFVIFNTEQSEQLGSIGANNNMEGISGGSANAYLIFTLTSENATDTDTKQTRNPDTVFALLSRANNGSIVTASSRDADSLPNPIFVANHVYTVLGTEVGEDGERYVRLRNPWGRINGDDTEGSTDGVFLILLSEFQQNFCDVSISEVGDISSTKPRT